MNDRATRLLIGSAIAATILTTGCGQQTPKSSINTQAPAYSDSKGFFEIRPPVGWRRQEYPQDPRGKVAFLAPGGQCSLRVLAKAVEIEDYDGLLQDLKAIERRLGVQMNIEPVRFNGMPAFKRLTTITMHGATQKMLSIDLLIDGVSHNLQYGGPAHLFDRYYNDAWRSMQTYSPQRRSQPATPEEARQHEAAKWFRLARIALDMGKVEAAKEAVAAGLEVAPENEDLRKVKAEMENR